MNFNRKILAASVAALLAAPAAHAEITIDDFWGSEVSFEGLVQADFVRYDREHWNPNNRGQDGMNADNKMRRAELVLKGKGPDSNEWVVGYDAYAKKWLDVNWKYKFGNNSNHYLQVGQYKQPNSMEELSSTKNNDFISKASITNTFGVARRVGVGYNYGDNNWAINASIFGRELTRGGNVGNGYGVRGYFAPINDKGSILHLGLSYVNYEARNGGAGVPGDDGTDGLKTFSARPMNDLSNAFVSTGTFDRAKRVQTLGGEAFWVRGPFKLQGEYMRTNVSRTASGLKSFEGSGGYVSGVWNVTGETWGYKAGTPTTSLPNEPATGMVQLGLRYDTIDLNSGNTAMGANNIPYIPADGTILGGKMNSWTLGVNYYWHSNFKFALNYVMADMNKFTGKTSSTYSLDPAWNGRTINGGLTDKPRILELRAQFYW